ncbi:MAG: restriction endonuclease [Nitrospirota bacterium]
MDEDMAPVLAYEFAESTTDYVTVYDYTDINDVYVRECPYCNSENLLIPKSTDSDGLCLCKYCGWWKLLDLGHTGGFGVKKVSSTTAIAKEFSVSALDVPIEALRSFLVKKPNSLAYVNPHVFEKLMKDCLRDVYDNCTVLHVGGTDDGGIDLKLIHVDGSCSLVQVKRRSDLNGREGVEVVRSLNGVLFQEGIPKGMIITTAKAFTKRAIESTRVKTPTLIPYDMKLIAFDEVVSMLRLKPILPYEPWKKFSLIDRRERKK